MPDDAHNSSEIGTLLAQLNLTQDVVWHEIDKHVDNMREKIGGLGNVGAMAAFLGAVVQPMDTAVKDTLLAHAILRLAQVEREHQQRVRREI